MAKMNSLELGRMIYTLAYRGLGLLAIGASEKVFLFDIHTWDFPSVFDIGGDNIGLAFSGRGQFLAIARTSIATVRVLNYDGGWKDYRRFIESWGGTTAVQFHPSSSVLVVGGTMGKLYFLDVINNSVIRYLETPDRQLISSFDLTADSALLAAGLVNGQVAMWEWSIVAQIWKERRPVGYQCEEIRQVGFCPRKPALVTIGQEAGNPGRLRFWQPFSGVEDRSFETSTREFRCFAFHGGGLFLAAADRAGNIMIWSIRKRQVIGEISAPAKGAGECRAICFCGQADLAVAVNDYSNKGQLRVYNLRRFIDIISDG